MLSIIGLHASFADAQNIDQFERLIFQGKGRGKMRAFSARAACEESLAILLENKAINTQDVCVIVLCAALNHSDKALLNARYPHFYQADDLLQAMEIAQDKSLSAIIAVSTAEEAEFIQSANLSFGKEFTHYQQSAGVAALLFANAEYCRAAAPFVYAHIRAFCQGEDIAACVEQALYQANCRSEDIAYLELSSRAEKNLQQQESLALCSAYQQEKTLQTAIGSVRSVIGAGGVFAQLAGLLKAALVLQQRYFPATADWLAATESYWQNSAFYIPCESTPWFSQSVATAAFSCQTQSDYGHFILQENNADALRDNGYLATSELVLIPLQASTSTELFTALDALETQLEIHTLRELANTAYAQFLSQKQHYCLCLLAENKVELSKEIALAKAGIAQALTENTDWKTPKGSYFTAAPLHSNDGVSFLYPGIGATYVGLGRALFHLFPEIYSTVAALADNIGESLKDHLLNPRSMQRLSFQELKARDHALRHSLADIAECGVGFACIFTKIFEQVFGLKAQFATGYSMGEISMYAALGNWQKPGVMSKRLAQSATFNHHLTGELQTLRQHWGLPRAQRGQIDNLWETYTLKATVEEINEAAADEDRVYCTIINTPDSLVIGGDPAACQRVIKKLGVRAMVLDMSNAIHSPPAFLEYKQMEALYTMDVVKKVDTKLYSSSCYLPVPQRSKAIANSIAKCLCDPVDFPRLIQAMYDKGARVFIEMGPGRSLSSWVEKILQHQQNEAHLTVPVNAKGTSDELTLLRALAKLISHGVEVDIRRLYHGTLIK